MDFHLMENKNETNKQKYKPDALGLVPFEILFNKYFTTAHCSVRIHIV